MKHKMPKMPMTSGSKIKRELSKSMTMKEINASQNSSMVKGKKVMFKAHAKLGPGGEVKASHSSVKHGNSNPK